MDNGKEYTGESLTLDEMLLKPQTGDAVKTGYSADPAALFPTTTKKRKGVKAGKEASTAKIIDFISGLEVNAGPEERESVQPFSHELVEQYGYQKDQIQTHPQYRVGTSPSATQATFPLDIVVFETAHRDPKQIRLIVECKERSKKEGVEQLKKYMGLTSAQYGVWHNGDSRCVFRKVTGPSGYEYQEVGDLPMAGQSLTATGLALTKAQLLRGQDLKAPLDRIRNHLAGNNTGITNDAQLTEEIINLILCKIFDERETAQQDPLTFCAAPGEKPSVVRGRIASLFDQVKRSCSDIFDSRDKLSLTDESIVFCVQALQNISMMHAARDAIGDAFETFMGPTLRGDKGQFFTPKNVTRFVVEMLDPTPDKTILDPACGSGGFLVSALESVWAKLDAKKELNGWTDAQLENQRQNVAQHHFFGLDKDRFLTKVAKSYMALLGDGKGGIFCEDTLADCGKYNAKTQSRLSPFQFDLVVANPPYGKSIKIENKETLQRYDLGHRFDAQHQRLDKVMGARSPQVLFVEKILGFLKPGAMAGIVLPESLFVNDGDRYLVKYITERASVEAVVSLAPETFQPSTDIKTCVILLRKPEEGHLIKPHNIFMALCRHIGHDKRGKPTDRDDLPAILQAFQEFKKKGHHLKTANEHGFVVKSTDIDGLRFTPHFYWNRIKNAGLYDAKANYVSLGDLMLQGVLSAKTGKAVESSEYISSGIPFIRTSDLHNFEIAYSPAKSVSREHYEEVKADYDARPGDILFVTRGRSDTDRSNGLIGNAAMVLPSNGEFIYQGGMTRLRIENPKNVHKLTAETLVRLLSEPVVRAQIRQMTGVEGNLSGLNQTSLQALKIRMPAATEMATLNKEMKAVFRAKEMALSKFKPVAI